VSDKLNIKNQPTSILLARILGFEVDNIEEIWVINDDGEWRDVLRRSAQSLIRKDAIKYIRDNDL